ncbi:MAG: nucleoside recognition domain-containing protein [Microscillaceae bacterium]|nr:nucleoside recognition domain-containing protein [Microscillaceae bacterium]
MALNYIWIAFFLIAFCIASFQLIIYKDTTIFEKLVESTFSSSETAFELSIGLTGAMALWLGIMKIGEKAGIVNLLTFLFGPFFQRLFPEIPKNHPAIAPIFLKLSANLLGLVNAGTPLGIKAMREMQTLNKTPDTASNAQIMFAVLNTTGFTLIPVTILAYRTQMGAANPSDVFIPILLSTTVTALSAMIMVAIIQRINLFDPILLLYLLGIVGLIVSTIYYFSIIPDDKIRIVTNVVSNFILFFIIIFFIVMGLFKGVNVYEAFIEGAKDGFDVAIKIIPYLVGILVGIAVFRTAGALDLLNRTVESIFEYFYLNGEFVLALPVAYLKPLSGSGSSGMMLELMDKKYGGPDTFHATLACVFQGTTDTTLYILAIYFGSVNIKKTRYAATVGLLADFIGLSAAVYITYIFYQ